MKATSLLSELIDPQEQDPSMINALARLLELAPAPSEPRRKDWDEVERSLEAELPADYKELIHVYGGSNWDDYLYVLEPGCPNENYDLLEWAKNQAEDLEDLWEFEKKPTGTGGRWVPGHPMGNHGQRRMPLLACPAGPQLGPVDRHGERGARRPMGAFLRVLHAIPCILP